LITSRYSNGKDDVKAPAVAAVLAGLLPLLVMNVMLGSVSASISAENTSTAVATEPYTSNMLAANGPLPGNLSL
jgi:hypothetical protein